jgi:hypothetical protein
MSLPFGFDSSHQYHLALWTWHWSYFPWRFFAQLLALIGARDLQSMMAEDLHQIGR